MNATATDTQTKLREARDELEWTLGQHGWMADGPAIQSLGTAVMRILEVLEEELAPELPEGLPPPRDPGKPQLYG